MPSSSGSDSSRSSTSGSSTSNSSASRSSSRSSRSSPSVSTATQLSKKRKRELDKALSLKGWQRKSALALLPYTDFARWYTRSENLFVDWYRVFQYGIAWDTMQLEGLSRRDFMKQHGHHVDIYLAMSYALDCFDNDLRYFEIEPDKIVGLAKAMSGASKSARSDDISSLKYLSLVYTAQFEPGQKLHPFITPGESKSTMRGFNHPQLARLLCPVKDLEDFNKNPAEFRIKLANGSVKVRAKYMPSFIWPKDEYDPEDPESNMFRNLVLVMTFKHLFTSPSSALKELPGQTKTRSSQAQMHRMMSVTAPSIAYTCTQYRYSISSVEDWRHDERLFKRKDFYDHILRIVQDLQNEEPERYEELIEWWDGHVFGTDPDGMSNDSDNDEGLSTIAMLTRQRKERKAKEAAEKAEKEAAERSAQPSQAPPPSTEQLPGAPRQELPHQGREQRSSPPPRESIPSPRPELSKHHRLEDNALLPTPELSFRPVEERPRRHSELLPFRDQRDHSPLPTRKPSSSSKQPHVIYSPEPSPDDHPVVSKHSRSRPRSRSPSQGPQPSKKKKTHSSK